jgi:hypothetical protein
MSIKSGSAAPGPCRGAQRAGPPSVPSPVWSAGPGARDGSWWSRREQRATRRPNRATPSPLHHPTDRDNSPRIVSTRKLATEPYRVLPGGMAVVGAGLASEASWRNAPWGWTCAVGWDKVDPPRMTWGEGAGKAAGECPLPRSTSWCPGRRLDVRGIHADDDRHG